MPKSPRILVMTRPEAQSLRVLAECEARLGGPIAAIISPVLKIVPKQIEIDGTEIDALIFTSANAVEALDGKYRKSALRAYCVGAQTERAARRAGFDAVSAGGTSEDLIALISRSGPAGRIVHIRGKHAAGDLVGTLRERGLDVLESVVYDQVAKPLSSEAVRAISTDGAILPLFSPRSAALVKNGVPQVSPLTRVVAISTATAAAFDHNIPAKIASNPDGSSMIEAIVSELAADATC